MAEYRLTPAAQNDLNNIFDYTTKQWGTDQAVLYIQKIEEACKRFAKAPLQAQDCSEIRLGYRRGIIERHAIYFRVQDYGIAVNRILHQQMEARHHT